MRELLARVRVLFRRTALESAPKEAPLRAGDLELDLQRYTVKWKGQAVNLTVTEFMMLHALVRHPGHVKSRKQLHQEGYPHDAYVSERTIDSHIKRLRRKFEEIDAAFDCIETVSGVKKRIAIRLLAFNLLLVFLPVAGVLYLGAYEARLESAEARSIAEQGRIVATALGRDAVLNPIDADELLARARSEVRFRVLDTAGRVIADSRPLPQPQTSRGSPRHNTLYRIAVFVARPVLRLMTPPEPPLDVDLYDSADRLLGPEVRAAPGGRGGSDQKISAGGQR